MKINKKLMLLRQEDQIPNVNLPLNVVINEIQCNPEWISHMQMSNTSWLSYRLPKFYWPTWRIMTFNFNFDTIYFSFSIFRLNMHLKIYLLILILWSTKKKGNISRKVWLGYSVVLWLVLTLSPYVQGSLLSKFINIIWSTLCNKVTFCSFV